MKHARFALGLHRKSQIAAPRTSQIFEPPIISGWLDNRLRDIETNQTEQDMPWCILKLYQMLFVQHLLGGDTTSNAGVFLFWPKDVARFQRCFLFRPKVGLYFRPTFGLLAKVKKNIRSICSCGAFWVEAWGGTGSSLPVGLMEEG